MKCDKCGRVATIHITEIRRGIAYDRHLCESCAETFLPIEESNTSEFLDLLPPKGSEHPTAEGEPTRDEMDMTGVRQRVFVADLATGERFAAGPRVADSWHPAWSPDSKRLAMCHGTEDLPSLAVVEPGTPEAWHFIDTTFSEPPTWSHDSRRIAFSHEDAGLHVVAADLDAGELLRVSEEADAHDFLPAWSPRDDRLAFVSVTADAPGEPPMECAVNVARPGTDERRRVIAGDSMLVGVGWSADAQWLAAAATEGAEEEAGPEGPAYVVRCARADGSVEPFVIPRLLTGTWVPRAANFSDAPAILAMIAAGTGARTVLIDPASRRRRTLADDLSFPAGLVRPSHLSPDGRLLAALRGVGTIRIAILDLVTGNISELDPRGEVAWFGWLPDGSGLAALVRDSSGVRLEVLSPTGDRRTVTLFARADFFDAPSASISPDGKRVAIEVHVTADKG